jgi:DNA-binding PadR family transcriptional regulator
MAELNPTPTSYAVLGLLSLRPWTTYELARQSERSLRWFFPRAERAVYLEAKRLVALGWARPKRTSTGRRASTVYRITKAGENALRDWLAAPSAPAVVESEAALKVFYADRADIAQLRATIDGIREQASAALDQLAEMAGGAPQFPERADTNVLSMRLIADIHRTLYDWTAWAERAVDVLDKGDERAITRQTRRALDGIAASAAQTRDG